MHVDHKAVSVVAALAALGLAAASPAAAQINTIASFNGTGTNGANPFAGLTFDSQGNLYGTTLKGGTLGFGTLFEIKSGSNTITDLASFNNTNGKYPYANLIFDSLGNLYGTTSQGGTFGAGIVFEVKSGSNAITTLANFNVNTGAVLEAGLIFDNQGNLYGTTYLGGSYDVGNVFDIKSGSNVITPLASFTDANGADSNDLIFDSQGNLYGTAQAGGANGKGAVFEVKNGSNTIIDLAFFNGANGADPAGALTFDSQGNLYGTTYIGGTNNLGTVFEIKSGSNTITDLANFTGTGTDGANPVRNLILDSQGNFYGTTKNGGTGGFGTLFEIKSGSNTITDLASFNGLNGSNPEAGLTFDSRGNLYGTTYSGGTFAKGTVFELDNPNAVLVPESSGLANLSGALLALGLGGLVTAIKKKRAKASA